MEPDEEQYPDLTSDTLGTDHGLDADPTSYGITDL